MLSTETCETPARDITSLTYSGRARVGGETNIKCNPWKVTSNCAKECTVRLKGDDKIEGIDMHCS